MFSFRVSRLFHDNSGPGREYVGYYVAATEADAIRQVKAEHGPRGIYSALPIPLPTVGGGHNGAWYTGYVPHLCV
jgi:hypothetical protein